MLDYIIQFLSDNPVVATIATLIATLVGIVAIPLAIILNRAKKKKVFYVVKTDTLISNFNSTIPGIEITHNSNKVESLYSSKIYVWNGSKTLLEKTDFHADKPLAIIFNGRCNILNAATTSETDDTCKFDLYYPNSGNRIAIEFECLERSYGGTFQILHTGGYGKIQLDGKIKNNGKIIELDNLSASTDIVVGWASLSLMVLYSLGVISFWIINGLIWGVAALIFLLLIFLLILFAAKRKQSRLVQLEKRKTNKTYRSPRPRSRLPATSEVIPLRPRPRIPKLVEDDL